MRSSYYLLGAAMILLLTCAAQAQDFNLQLTPPNPPIEISQHGGSFSYQVAVTNNDSTPQGCTLWCIVTAPDGEERVTLQPWTAGFAAGQTMQRSFTQSVPASSATGNYRFTANIGIYPNTVWDSDQFTFYKLKPPEWVACYNGPGNGGDGAYALVVDSENNVYVTGTSGGSGTSLDFATIKYNPSGNQLWAARYNGPGNDIDGANSLAVDSFGNVYVTGYSYGIRTGIDLTTIKYGANGNQLWVARYNGLGNIYDGANSLVLDSFGNVYVTGYSYGSGTARDYATIKYDSSGNQLWVALYNGPGNDNDEALSIAADGSGNVYVTGWSYGIETGEDFATIKYNPSGNQLWVARYNGSENGSDQAYSLALDEGGNVYVTGYSYSNGTSRDYATIKYDTFGNQLWIARYNGPGNYEDEANSLTLDSYSNVYVTGYSYGSWTYQDYATIKYDADGNQLWVARYDGPGSSDIAYSLALDNYSNVYVTGWSYGSGTARDYATIKYDVYGNQLWVARYNGTANADDNARSLAVDNGGNVYVTGYSTGIGTGCDYATIKYSGGNLAGWEPVIATVLGAPLPSECRLEQNYPNPFNALTTISYQLSAISFVNLSVYDITGKIVVELINSWREAGSHEVTFDASGLPSGVYIYRLTASGSEATPTTMVQKMALLK